MTLLLCSAILFASSVSLLAQHAAEPRRGTVQRIVVHGKSLEGNLEGDSADRDVAVYLPPSYDKERKHHYPVVYLLHGFTDDVDHWWGVKKHFVDVPAIIDRALAAGQTREMIVVMPNAFTRYQGSMYSSSVTTGDWESFVANELVAYIDSHYRTIPERASRGLAGHSMGGYGTLRIGMKRPDVYSSLYALSPCCLTASMQPPGKRFAAAEAIQNPTEVEKADFMTKAALASAAAWSPNPSRPPLFYDLPSVNGEFQPAVAAKWAANAPLAIIDQYIPNLKRYTALAFDAGNQDAFIAGTVKTLDQVLNGYQIKHTFEIYTGTHIDHVAERLETKTLPFFSANLSFGKTGQ